jgi:hypothetical protein
MVRKISHVVHRNQRVRVWGKKQNNAKTKQKTTDLTIEVYAKHVSVGGNKVAILPEAGVPSNNQWRGIPLQAKNTFEGQTRPEVWRGMDEEGTGEGGMRIA